ncbi:MAG TPA: Hsp33 family molecular chaperone HslO [Clostridia bacterium]|nr:Hsp33 family molecular chaperone HslO [Clostridia bacterium]
MKVLAQGNSYLVQATAAGGKIRGVAAVTTEIVEEIRRIHDTFPTATAALGRTISGTVLLSASLKGNEKVTVRVIGDGPIGGIIADVDSEGAVRGYVQNPHLDLPLNEKGKLAVGEAVGKNGYLYVTKDLGLKEPYNSSCQLVSGEIGDDFAAYLYYSEQIPSAVGVGVLVNPDFSVQAAGGYLIQLLPETDKNLMEEMDARITNLDSVTKMLSEGASGEEILSRIFAGYDPVFYDRKPLAFKCRCSRERLEQILITLGEKEIKDMIEEQNGAELKCHFCNRVYTFSKEDLTKLLEQM